MPKSLVTTVIFVFDFVFLFMQYIMSTFQQKIAGQMTQFKDTQQDGEQDESRRTLDPPPLINVSKPQLHIEQLC